MEDPGYVPSKVLAAALLDGPTAEAIRSALTDAQTSLSQQGATDELRALLADVRTVQVEGGPSLATLADPQTVKAAPSEPTRGSLG